MSYRTYRKNKFSARGQFTHANLNDVGAYNALTGRDLGSEIGGYYLEAAYNLLPITNRQRLDGFVRYENYDTHKAVEASLQKNLAYHRKEWTFGFSYHLSPGSVFKVDYQRKATALGNDAFGQFNMGVGVWF